MNQTRLTPKIQTARLAWRAARSIGLLLSEEWRRGTLMTNLKGLSERDLAQDMSWAELLEERAGMVPDKTFLLYKDERFTSCRRSSSPSAPRKSACTSYP